MRPISAARPRIDLCTKNPRSQHPLTLPGPFGIYSALDTAPGGGGLLKYDLGRDVPLRLGK